MSKTILPLVCVSKELALLKLKSGPLSMMVQRAEEVKKESGITHTVSVSNTI